MEEIQLIKPSLEYDEEIQLFKKEILESKDNDKFAGCGSLSECTSTKEWIEYLKQLENVETCPEWAVTSETYLAVRILDNKLVGIIDLRHHINHPILGLWGGHIGYSVRPTEREKGYAKRMLELNLANCRDRKIHKVMISCCKENIISEKVIIANGGIFEKEIQVDNKIMKRYWIDLNMN